MTQAEHVLIRGKVLLYKQKAPFVSSGVSIKGAIEYDPVEDKLRCHECGDWFKNLGLHAARAHGLPARAYKPKHGLRQGTALLNEKLRAECIAKGQRLIRLGYASTAEDRQKGTRASVIVSRLPRPVLLELRNERNMNSPQLAQRIAAIAAANNGMIGEAALRRAGISPKSARFAANVNSQAALARLFGFKVRPACSRAFICEMIRDFFARHGRRPSRSDLRRGLVQVSRSTIQRHFGNLRNAFKAAGLDDQEAA